LKRTENPDYTSNKKEEQQEEDGGGRTMQCPVFL